MIFFKIFFVNFLFSIRHTANASPSANCEVVLDVGTIRPASITSGIKILISEPLYKIEFFLKQSLSVKFYLNLHIE